MKRLTTEQKFNYSYYAYMVWMLICFLGIIVLGYLLITGEIK